MTPDNVHIEVDRKFLQKFFGLADSEVPQDLSLDTFSTALNKIKEKLSSSALSSTKEKASYGEQEEIQPEGDLKVLIIDNVGFIMHRLKQLLSREDAYVDTTEDVNKAIEKINKINFTYIVMNLLMPTEREGMMFLKEVYKALEKTQADTKIIVTGESIKKELIILFKERGIDHVIERKLDWVSKLMEIFEGNESS